MRVEELRIYKESKPDASVVVLLLGIGTRYWYVARQTDLLGLQADTVAW